MNAVMNRLRVEDVLKATGLNRSQLARELGVSREAVYQWGEHVPQKRMQAVYELMGRCLQLHMSVQGVIDQLSNQQKTPAISGGGFVLSESTKSADSGATA